MTIKNPFAIFAFWNKPVFQNIPRERERSSERQHNILKMNKIKNNIKNELQMELCAPHPGGNRGSQ